MAKRDGAAAKPQAAKKSPAKATAAKKSPRTNMKRPAKRPTESKAPAVRKPESKKQSKRGAPDERVVTRSAPAKKHSRSKSRQPPQLGVSSRIGHSGWLAMVVGAPGGTADADRLLDAMLASGWIGGARREVVADLLAGKVRAPMGPWGLVVQLAGHPWVYLLGDNLRYEWPKELAEKLGVRSALFQYDGTLGTLRARAYEGRDTLFEFEHGGLVSADGGREVVQIPGDLFSMAIRGRNHDAAWLRKFKSGEAAQDALAREIGLYIPALWQRAAGGKAGVWGADAAKLKPADYARIDLFVFGDASTLEPSPASFALSEAIHAGDAAGVRAALAQGADVRYLPDDSESPLHKALGLGAGGLYDWKYKRITREQQLEVLAALLEAGANPDPKDMEPAVHRVLFHGDKGDERTIVRQLRLLFDHGADPNATGTYLRSAGQRPLHVVARYQNWPAVLKLLVSRGADPKLTDAAGRTPLEAAQSRLGYLNESRAKLAGPGPGTFEGAMGNLVGKKSGAGAALVAGMVGQLVAEANDEVAGLKATIAFLAAAERGEADTSGIDELAEASWEKWIADHERWKASRKAADPARWKLLHGED